MEKLWIFATAGAHMHGAIPAARTGFEMGISCISTCFNCENYKGNDKWWLVDDEYYLAVNGGVKGAEAIHIP